MILTSFVDFIVTETIPIYVLYLFSISNQSSLRKHYKSGSSAEFIKQKLFFITISNGNPYLLHNHGKNKNENVKNLPYLQI